MKIVKLESENIKKIKVVEITPDGNVVVIGGKNAQGKSSTLDSIMYAIGGKGSIPGKPVRKGQKKAKVQVDLGDLQVTRTITPTGGGTLTVRNADGARYDSPQKILDALTGKLTFDPLKWSEMDSKTQAEVLQDLVNLNFDELNSERLEAFTARTSVKRDLKVMNAQLKSMPEGDPDLKKVNIGELGDKIAKGQGVNADNDSKRRKFSKVKAEYAQLKREIEGLREGLKRKEEQFQELEHKMYRMGQHIDSLENVDLTELASQVSDAENTNRLVQEATDLSAMVENITDTEKTRDQLTEKIKEIDKRKETALAEAKFPVSGLSFDEDGVTYNGIPFNQCSTAERLRISVAMGFAMNPKLKVLLIREGSHLDEDSLALVTEMAAKHEGQVWIEVVGDRKECSIIMEEGEVKGAVKEAEKITETGGKGEKSNESTADKQVW
jgi:recombinational DNA repair ATPase RecF